MNVVGGASVLIIQVRAIRNETAGGDEEPKTIDGGQLISRGKSDDWVSMNRRLRACGDDKPTGPGASKRRYRALEVVRPCQVDRAYLKAN